VEKNKDKDREFRLRPRKPAARGEHRVYASAYKIIMHHARMSGVRKRRVVGFGKATTRARPYSQRCAVRVLYSKNTSKGQWRAHGRYVARESATNRGDSRDVGFSTSKEAIDIATRLDDWQKASDERLWKLIVSPEFWQPSGPETIDSRSHVRDADGPRYAARMDRGGALQHRAPPCSYCAARCRSRRTADSSQPGLHSGRHPRSRGESMHAPAWVSHRARCGRRAAKGSSPAPLHIA
jgi:hypothetical protein